MKLSILLVCLCFLLATFVSAADFTLANPVPTIEYEVLDGGMVSNVVDSGIPIRVGGATILDRGMLSMGNALYELSRHNLCIMHVRAADAGRNEAMESICTLKSSNINMAELQGGGAVCSLGK